MILSVGQNAEGFAVVTARSEYSGHEHTRVYPMSKADLMQGLAEYLSPFRPLIQNVFPSLSADDREFLMTGMTPEEWEGMGFE